MVWVRLLTFHRCLGSRMARCSFVRSGTLRRLDEEEEGELCVSEGSGE